MADAQVGSKVIVDMAHGRYGAYKVLANGQTVIDGGCNVLAAELRR